MAKSKLLAILGILACLAGCGDSDSIEVIVSRGNKATGKLGNISLRHKHVTYFDYSLDGSLDKVIYFDRKGNPVTILPGSLIFKEFEKDYKELRKKYTKGE